MYTYRMNLLSFVSNGGIDFEIEILYEIIQNIFAQAAIPSDLHPKCKFTSLNIVVMNQIVPVLRIL